MRKICLIALLSLASCTSYVWVKPVGDPATFEPDSYGCKQEALAAAPPVFQTVQPVPRLVAGPDIVRSRCIQDGPIQSCQTRYYTPYDYSYPPTTYDLNEPMRNDLYNSCMRSKGWVLQAVETQ